MIVTAGIAVVILCLFSIQSHAEEKDSKEVEFLQVRQLAVESKQLPAQTPRFLYDSGLTFEYPDAIRGIYVTGHSAGGSRF